MMARSSAKTRRNFSRSAGHTSRFVILALVFLDFEMALAETFRFTAALEPQATRASGAIIMGQTISGFYRFDPLPAAGDPTNAIKSLEFASGNYAAVASGYGTIKLRRAANAMYSYLVSQPFAKSGSGGEPSRGHFMSQFDCYAWGPCLGTITLNFADGASYLFLLKSVTIDPLKANSILQPSAPSPAERPTVLTPASGQQYISLNPVPIKINPPPKMTTSAQVGIDGKFIPPADTIHTYSVKIERWDNTRKLWLGFNILSIPAAEAQSPKGYTAWGAPSPGDWRLQARVELPTQSDWSPVTSFRITNRPSSTSVVKPSVGFGK